MTVNYMTFSINLSSFEFVYFNDDFSVCILVGCNGRHKFFDSSDVLILSKEDSPNFEDIEKAMEEVGRLKFDITDLVSKNNFNCSVLMRWEHCVVVSKKLNSFMYYLLSLFVVFDENIDLIYFCCEMEWKCRENDNKEW